MRHVYDVIESGNPLRAVVGATVQVNVAGGGPAVIYDDLAGTILAVNPVTTDARGAYSCYVPDGLYDLIYQGTRLTTLSVPNVEITSTRGGVPGAVMNGVTSDSAAITAALAALVAAGGSTLELPAGTFALGSPITVPLTVTLRGQGATTILKPLAATATAVICASGSTLADCAIDGTATTGATGVSIGAASLVSNVRVCGVTVSAFTGTGAVGLSVQQGVSIHVSDVYLSGCTTDLVTGSLVTGTPTNSLFAHVQCHSAVGRGAWIQGGNSLLFLSCLFEANGEEGLYIGAPLGLNALDIRVWGGWFEANWQSVTAGALRHAQYECVANGTGAGTVRPEWRSCYFNTSATTARSLHAVAMVDGLLDHVTVFNEAANILVDAASSATVTHWPAQNGAYLTTLSNLGTITNTESEVTDAIEGAWATWTPALAAAGAMTTTGVTIQRARWKRVGHTLHVSLKVSFTIGGTPNIWVSVSLPAGLTVPTDQETYLPALGIEPAGSTFIPLAARPITATPPLLQVYRTDFANWAAGIAQVNCTAAFEVL